MHRITISHIDILSIIFNEHLPVKIHVFESLRDMNHDPNAYNMMFMMGLLQTLTTYDIVRCIAESKNDHFTYIFKYLIKPHYLLAEPTSCYTSKYKWRNLVIDLILVKWDY